MCTGTTAASVVLETHALQVRGLWHREAQDLPEVTQLERGRAGAELGQSHSECTL